MSSTDTPRRDPTQTTTSRSQFRSELSRRVREVRGQVRQQVERQNQPNTIAFVGAATTGFGGFAMLRSLGAFRRWLSGLFDNYLLENTSPQPTSFAPPYVKSYIRESYLTGLRQGRAALRAQGYGIDSRGVEAVIADERHQRALSSLYERSYYDLQDAIDNSVQSTSRAIADGGYIGEETVRGDVNKRELAGTLNERIDANEGKRLDPLADSIPVQSANVAALGEYSSAGVEQVGVEPEAGNIDEAAFVTAQDDRVCQECLSIAANNPYPIDEVPLPSRDTHLRCRCFILAL